MATEPIIVRAIHNFKGNNNDELNFKKGDLITLTQKDEGWWEGTLNGKTGWFPSNYVKECKDAPKPIIHQQSQYKAVVLKDLIDSEKAHVTELEGLMTMFLHPLEKSTILTEDEYKQLTGNIGSVLEMHQQLLQLLEIESSKNGLDQRVGQLFLNWAPKIKNVHQTYCSLHPKAVCIIDKHKEELNKYMESRGATSPGVLVLTTMLSKPFRRLDKYSGMLQELERHVEECHPDRGDTQRSVAVYKDLATSCTATRRQKELELQVLTGPIRDLEGPPLSTLGDIIYMGSVAFGPQHHDRYFVLFPSTLVILSVSHRLSAFIYEGRLVLSSVNVARLEDTDKYKNAFEISSPMIDRKLVICQSRDEANHWVELLRRGGTGAKERTISQIKTTPPQPPPHQLNQRGYSTRTSVITFQPQIDYTPTLPPITYPSAAPYAGLTKFFSKLIKNKSITHKLLKQLLYSEYLNKMNLNLVKVRHHKSECYIRTRSHYRDSVINCDSDSDTGSSLESESESEGVSKKRDMKRQNAVYSASNKSSSNSSSSDDDDDANPFGYIRYYNPNQVKMNEKHESFIDYGIVPSPKMVPDSGSQEKKSIICTSSVNVLLKQCSEESSISSNYQSKPSLACENLTNLHDSIELKTLNVPKQIYIPTTRQSCPTKFVGNRFNQTSLTTIYIPTPSNSDNDLSLQENKLEISSQRCSNCSNNSTTTHSSSLEVPINIVPLPDPILAEILYNNLNDDEIYHRSSSFDSDFTRHSGKTVIKPPRQFANDDECEIKEDNFINEDNNIINKEVNLSISKSSVSLNLENIGFRKHSINSDKPKSEQLKRRRSIHIFPSNNNYALSSPGTSRNVDLPSQIPTTHKNEFCKCCMEYSPRSSDSGMAGSCTLNSPDLMNPDEDENVVQENYDDFLERTGVFHEMEAKDYESQCQCTSPFGSTPRTSCQESLIDQTNLLRISQASFDSSSDPHTVDLIKTKMHSQESVNSTNSGMGGAQKSKSESNLLDNVEEETEEHRDQPIYRSGLYAHWWLKAKIPAEVVRGIYEETRQNNSQTDVAVNNNARPRKQNKSNHAHNVSNSKKRYQ